VTDRIYYADSTCTEFDATVLRCGTVDGRAVAVLDRTAFYPTSGGQPFDTGSLGGVRVVDVVDLDDETVGHVMESMLQSGGIVHGSIDRARRFDHMQQHTGQHILSAAFDRLNKARTVGFHLGAVVSSLDLDKVLSPESIAVAESEANRIVWENREVGIRFAPAEEAAALGLRKDPARIGTLRVIEVADYDRSACGGTHVARTGEIGVVAIKSWEKLRGGLRLEFVCGGRALREYRTVRDAVAGCIRHVSVAPEDLPAAIEKMQGESRDLRKIIRGQQEQLAVHEAGALFSRGSQVGGATVVVEALDGWDQNGLKALAVSVASRPGVVAALLSTSTPALIVIARSSDLAFDSSVVLRALIAQFGGKGGGKPEMAQGGGLVGEPSQILSALRHLVDQELTAKG
jgi:alanyl-tRNA synthetase